MSYAAVFEGEEHRHPSFVSSGMKRENGARLWRQRLGFHYPYPFGSPPVRELGEVTLRYLRGEGHDKGHYLAKNSIGELSFPSAGGDLTARHDLWFQPEGEVASDQASELASMHHLVEL